MKVSLGAQVHLYAKVGVNDKQITEETERLTHIAENRYIVLNDTQRAERHMEVGNRTGDIIIEIAPPARFKNANSMHISKGGQTNTTLPVFSNLEVYPALAKILGIAPVTPIDGKLDVLEKALTL